MNQTSIESQLAQGELLKLKEQGPGAVCQYAVLEAVIGIDPQRDKGYGYVKTARRALLSKHEMVLECVPNVGIKYLGPRDTINLGLTNQKRIRRAVRRNIQKLATVVPSQQQDLTNEERIAHSIVLSTMGVLEHVTRPATRKRIEAAVIKADRTLPVSQTLALFGAQKRDEAVQ